MTKASRVACPALVEAMEPRRFCDASAVTEAVASATVTTVSSAVNLSGTATVTVDNPGDAIKAPIGVSVYASTTPLGATPTDSNYLLGVKLSHAALKPGTTTFTVPLKSKKGTIPVDAYTLYAVVADTAAASLATTGPTLTVTAPVISLVPTETFKKPVTNVISGGKFSTTDVVKIANSGTDPSDGVVTVGVYASTDAQVNGAMLIGSVVNKTLSIAAGGSKTVSMPFKTFPSLAAGTYHLVTAVTDPNGVVTTADTATVNVTAGPVIHLTPTETFKKLPATVVSGGKFGATDVVKITNDGTDPSTGPITVAAYALPDGLFSDATPIGTAVTKTVKIATGGSTTVSLSLKAFPQVSAGTYDLITVVTDPNGVQTMVDTSTVTVTAVAG
jgi:hypothetical protein